MKQEIIQSHHLQCAGVEMHRAGNIHRLLPVVVNVMRNGVTQVLCHALKDDTCTAVSIKDGDPLPPCTYTKETIASKEKLKTTPISEVSLTETNINSTLICKIRDSFDVKTLGDIQKIDFEKMLELRGAGPQMIKSLLVELKTRGLKITTKKEKIDLQGYFHGAWAMLIDDTIEFGVTAAEDASSSS